VRCGKRRLWGGALRPPVFVCVSHSQSPWLPPLPVPHVVSLRTSVVCASSSGSCKVRVVAIQLEVGDHTPPWARGGERHGVQVVLCCVDRCGRLHVQGAMLPCPRPVPGASCCLCVTAYEVAVCGAGTGGCRAEHCVTPFVCCVYARPHSHRVPCPPPPARSPCSLPPPDLRCVHPVVDRVSSTW
jgi:hypothetical protein